MNKEKAKKKIKSSSRLRDLVDEWLDSKKNLKESTYTRYYYLINEHINNDIGHILKTRINTEI